MHIDIVPNRHSPPAILLRESVREGTTIRTRTLANLSQWDPARIEALRRALRGEYDHRPTGEPTCGPIFGVLYTLKQVAEDLGLPQVLGRTRPGKLALFLTLARVAHQGSRLSVVRWATQHAVSEVLGLRAFDEDDLYATLDTLAQRQERLEQRLYHRYLQRRGSLPLLFLYDVTSSYLEGDQNELAAYGYNRDGKRGTQHIVLGLLTDEVGEPLAVRVFEGNTADPDHCPHPDCHPQAPLCGRGGGVRRRWRDGESQRPSRVNGGAYSVYHGVERAPGAPPAQAQRAATRAV